jgi:hypothetical protein
LRQALGESQQAFAYRMKTAVRTIARWETTRPPTGKTLNDLYRVAIESGEIGWARFFRNAIEDDLGVVISPSGHQLTLDLELWLSRLESALADNHVKPGVRIEHALKEVSRIRDEVSAWNDRCVLRPEALPAEENPEPLDQGRSTKK